MPVLHVYRDPRAVIASIAKTAWHGLFDHLRLREQLLELPDGRADYFGRWRREIDEYDRGTRTMRLAGYWALTERFLGDAYAGHTGRFVCVSYERLIQERERAFAEILQRLGFAPRASDLRVRKTDSATTTRRRRGTSVQDRVTGWATSLSDSDRVTIETIARQVGLEDRLFDGVA
jgi:hypothetical protein